MRSKFKWIFTLLLAFSMQFSFAQEKTVTGVVTESGLPLPGVSVVIKGTTQGTQTDMDGKYSIKAKQGDVLVFSFVGLQTSNATVGASNKVNVAMQVMATQINEVVVGALGIKRKVDEITSSNQVVKAKELTQAANPNVVQSLAGKVSGLQINQTSNGVAATTKIVLRGNRSITGNNEALIVIDNAISSATALQQLPPEIIESVNVVKGAQGAALYGEQGVNGVIIVTTVKGKKSEKLSVSINSSIDFENISFLPKKQQKYGQGWDGAHDSHENGSWGPLYDGTLQPTGLPQADGSEYLLPYSPIKDNIKEFYQTGTITQTGITVNASSEDSYVLFSANRQKTEFVMPGDELLRHSFLLKAGKRLGKFSIDGNLNYISQRASQTTSTLLEDLLQTPGNIPIRNFENSGNDGHWTVYYKNPYWMRDNMRFDSGSNFVNGIMTFNYKINKNIDVNYVANLQLRTTENQSHTNALVDHVGTRSLSSDFYSGQTTTRNFYGDLLVNFNYMLTDNISLKANVGNNIQDNYFRAINQGGKNLDIPGWYHINNVLNPDLPSRLDNRMVRTRRVSFLANVDLGYKDYLFLNLTGRNDQTSVLNSDNQSFFYPSAGISFIPTKAFDIKGDILNYAKISASIVKVGNSSAVASYAINNIGVFPTGFPYGDTSSYIINQRPTDYNVKPEFVTTKEISANLGFFNDRLTLDASAYRADTEDLITFATTSSSSGLSAFQANIGAMKTTGYEVDLGFTPIKTKDFKWTARASYSTYKAVIKSLSPGVNEVNLLNQAAMGVGIYAQVGEEFPLIKGTTWVRDDQGRVVVNATTGMPTRTSTTSILGKSTPDYILGFTNSFEYKGLKLTAVMDYRTGHSIISETKRNLAWSGQLEESAEFDRDQGFIFPNSSIQTAPGVYQPNTSVYTSAGYSTVSGNIAYYDSYSRAGENNVIDATAFKVRELALSYELPTKMIEGTGLSSLRFGVNARNPFVVLSDENKGYTDPEASVTNGNAVGYSQTGQYPTTRTVGFSVNLTF